MEYGEYKRNLRSIVLEKLDYTREQSDEEILALIDQVILEWEQGKLLPISISRRLRTELFDSLRRLDILQNLVEDTSITEIMINGPDHIFVEKEGILKKWEQSFESEEKLKDVIQQIVAGCNRVVNEASPIVDARLANGSRVNIVMNPIALNGPIVTIRRFPDKPIDMERLISNHSITAEVADFLKALIIAKYNIFISGGTGSGKTTFLNVLSGFIPKDERIITIEDSAELQLQGLENLVRLETRNSNVEGCLEITMRELIKSSLRMRPDRIIVGEVRGAEAADMITCLNTGHEGSLSTGHANSAKDMLARLETMILMGMSIPLEAIRRQIASGIDILVHLGRLRDGSRKVLEVLEVIGYEEGEFMLNPLFQFEEVLVEESGSVVERPVEESNSVMERPGQESGGAVAGLMAKNDCMVRRPAPEGGMVIGRLCKKGELFNEKKLVAAGLR